MVRKIAIIEDCPEDRELYRYLLEKMGSPYHVIEFETGQQALNDLSSVQIDCVLLDYRLPDMNAIDILEKQQMLDVPVIILTGEGSEQVATRAFKLGAYDYVVKSSMTGESLCAAIDTAIQSHAHKKNEASLQKKIAFDATHDSLTHLYNRKYLETYFTSLSSKSLRHQNPFAVYYLDLDNFKSINDNFGHLVGDKILKSFAKRLQAIFRAEDVLSRIGGDEFVVLMEGTNLDQLSFIADKIIEASTIPFEIEEHQICTGASIGIYYYDGHEHINLDLALKKADEALYEVKQSGKLNYRFFDTEMQMRHYKVKYLKENLSAALLENKFRLIIRPQYQYRTHTIVALEINYVWDDEEFGILTSSEILSSITEKDQAHLIGLWLINTTSQMIEQGIIPAHIKAYINLSSSQLNHPSCMKALKKLSTNPKIVDSMVIEFNESHTTESPIIIQSLDTIHSFGYALAINDFSSSTFSLYLLSQLDISTLKFDLSFVRMLKSNKKYFKTLNFVKKLGHAIDAIIILKGLKSSDEENLCSQWLSSSDQIIKIKEEYSVDDLNHLFVSRRMIK